jgi:hypothetical protein
MCGQELGIEQRVPAGAQARHQLDQRYLAGIAHSREHALAEEDAA